MPAASWIVVLALAPVPERPQRPVATYSIVARDPSSGELGVAVQSHWFSVGAVVPWAEAGVGAVATQSLAEVSYGPLGLELMRAGKSAPDALKALLAADPEAAVRQVAMVDAAGRSAVHTGARCIGEAGHDAGEGFSVQANLMERDTVWPAMARAWRGSSGPLAERLLLVLEAAEREGGDVRGRQSAALLVVAGKPTGRPWADRKVELRVEDHPSPVEELRRLLRLNRAYEASNEGDERMGREDFPGALAAYSRAAALAPEQAELEFWQAVSLSKAGRGEESLAAFGRVFARDPRWREVARRLPPAGFLDAAALPAILALPARPPRP